MRVLLVQPSEKPVMRGRKKERGSIMPPLGIMSLASVLRRDIPGVEVQIHDFEAQNGSVPQFNTFDIIGITGTTVHMPHAYNLVSQIRAENPSAATIMGGPHSTFCADQLLEDIPELDGVIRGEGEHAFPALVRQFESRKSLPHVQGFFTRQNLLNEMARPVENLDDVPFPAYDLIELGRYQLSTHRRSLPSPFASLMTTRGCPYTCAYCQTPQMFGQALRRRAPLEVRRDIDRLTTDYDVKGIVFWDDTFTANRKRTIELCEAIQGSGVVWMCNTRVEAVDPELLLIMKSAGCRIIFYGVESGSEDTLRLLNRTHTSMLSRVREAFRWTHEAGIETVGTLMIGAPGDDQYLIEQNIRFLQSLNPTHVYISIYNVTPGAREYERAIAEGLILDENDRPVSKPNWGNERLFTGPLFGLPTVNRQMTRFDLQNAQRFAYSKFGDKGEYL